MGGALSLAAACGVPGLAAVAVFYGVPKPEYADYTRVTAPVQLHFGARDGSIPIAKAEGVHAALRAAGKDAELFVYDAGHAFMRASDPQAHDAPSAELAWQRMTSLFHAATR